MWWKVRAWSTQSSFPGTQELCSGIHSIDDVVTSWSRLDPSGGSRTCMLLFIMGPGKRALRHACIDSCRSTFVAKYCEAALKLVCPTSSCCAKSRSTEMRL